MAPESISLLPTGVKRISIYWIEAVFTTDISIYQEGLLLTAITSIDVLKEEHMGSVVTRAIIWYILRQWLLNPFYRPILE